MGGKSIISNSYLEDIGDAIRYKKGTDETFYPSQMGDAIRSIEGIVPTGTMEIDANGVYDVTEKASVDVDVQPDLRPLSVIENGTYEPEGFDGYSDVTVDVPATGYDKGTLIYEGDFSAAASQWNVTELPNGNPFSFDKIEVELSDAGQGYNSGWRQYWRSDLPQTGNQTYMFNPSGTPGTIPGATSLKVKTVIMVEDSEYISLLTTSYDEDAPTLTKAASQRIAHGGYDKITAYGWWSWICPAGAHIKITGYNRTST